MRVSFTFRNLESSDAIKEYASEKIGRLQKMLRAPIEADVVASVERHMQRVDITIHAGGERYAGSNESADMYASVDLAIDKIDQQVRRHKDADNRSKRGGETIAELTEKK